MKDIKTHINEANKKHWEIFYSYEHNDIRINEGGQGEINKSFKTIDEAVKEIWSKDSDVNIDIIRSDKFIDYLNK